jgi:hypothetical protein
MKQSLNPLWCLGRLKESTWISIDKRTVIIYLAIWGYDLEREVSEVFGDRGRVSKE